MADETQGAKERKRAKATKEDILSRNRVAVTISHLYLKQTGRLLRVSSEHFSKHV